jgi:hypothetical protein
VQYLICKALQGSIQAHAYLKALSRRIPHLRLIASHCESEFLIMCVHILLILLLSVSLHCSYYLYSYYCPHTTDTTWICVLILLHILLILLLSVSLHCSYYYYCPHTTDTTSICVLIRILLPQMCRHTTTMC